VRKIVYLFILLAALGVCVRLLAAAAAEQPAPQGADPVAPSPAAPAGPDLRGEINTRNESRMFGDILGIDKGVLRLTGPAFEGEVRLPLSAVDSIELRGYGADLAECMVELVNDDRLLGKLVSITSERVVLDSSAAGRLTMPVLSVRAIRMAGGVDTVLKTDFASRLSKPWKAVGGPWIVKDGAIECRTTGEKNYLVAELDAQSPLTFTVSVQSLDDKPMECDLVLFSDTDEKFMLSPGNRAAVLSARSGRINTRIVQPNHGNGSGGVPGSGLRKATLTLAFDPVRNRYQAWVDGEPVHDEGRDETFEVGRKIIFNTSRPVRIDSMTVARGMPLGMRDFDPTQAWVDRRYKPPPPVETGPAIVRFINGDHVEIRGVTAVDGKLSLTTANGPLVSQLSKVDFIRPAAVVAGPLPPKTAEARPLKDGEAIVVTNAGRMRLLIEGLTADTLTARSEHCGEVKIRRRSIHKIRFYLNEL
jgi:hypothetical protein